MFFDTIPSSFSLIVPCREVKVKYLMIRRHTLNKPSTEEDNMLTDSKAPAQEFLSHKSYVFLRQSYYVSLNSGALVVHCRDHYTPVS